MLLTLDVGNTQIFAGVFSGEKLLLRFRKTSNNIFTSDELGLFLRQILRENDIAPADITDVAAASVVPELGAASANVAENSDVARRVRASRLADSMRNRRRISPRFWGGAGRGSRVHSLCSTYPHTRGLNTVTFGFMRIKRFSSALRGFERAGCPKARAP